MIKNKEKVKDCPGSIYLIDSTNFKLHHFGGPKWEYYSEKPNKIISEFKISSPIAFAELNGVAVSYM